MNSMYRTQPGNQSYQASGELKGVDSQVNVGNVLATTNTNADIFPINLVQQGAGSWNRVGRKIRMKSLRIKGICQYSLVTSVNTFSNSTRMFVVYDRQPSSATVPTFDQIFGGTDQTGAEASTFLSNLRYDNTERFVVLKDEVFNSKNNVFNAANTAESQMAFDVYIKLKGLMTVFSGQSAPMTIADISSGAIYIGFRGEANSAANFATIKDSVVRLRYYD